jgi:hypothetical protein
MEKKHFDRISMSDFEVMMKHSLLESKDVRTAGVIRRALEYSLEQDYDAPDLRKEEELLDRLRMAASQKGLGATGEIIH